MLLQMTSLRLLHGQLHPVLTSRQTVKVAIVMLSTSHDQHAAASAMPAIGLEDIDGDSVVPVPAETEFRSPHCSEIKASLALLK